MVTKGTLLRLFRLHPFPLPMFETHHLMIDAEDDILAISSTDTRYNIQLSSTDLLSCHRKNQVFMCDSFGVMSRRFNDTCLGALYMQKFDLVPRPLQVQGYSPQRTSLSGSEGSVSGLHTRSQHRQHALPERQSP
jgi:hypothetical protein